ncbi:ABC transporter substrate-binding protein [Salinicoccus roseus]|uniref:ABC transporter substrate-binding protein n=1 Tax=Salinicoccus roseus TaxID=45670 RepID=UPI0023001991|nr:ABC transporter substrate-binding protein [Salinicoccus roseus]
MDKKLLLLHDFIENHEFDRRQIAERLEVSDRHLTRLLNLWHEEGVIEYKKGQGRGIHSEVLFKVNPEERFVNEFMRNINKLTLGDIEETLNLPISDISKMVIKEKTEMLLYQHPAQESPGEEGNVFVDYMDPVPEGELKKAACHAQSDHTLFNTMCRLYDLDDSGAVKRGLASFDEWHGNRLRIYIRKDIQFYNGDILYATDVVDSLNRYLQNQSSDVMDGIIQSIEVLSAFQLEIRAAYRTDLLKPMLTSLEAGIYKIEGEQVLTTGPFYVDTSNHSDTTLLRNPYYMNPAGDLKKIRLISDIEKYLPYLNQRDMETRSVPLQNRVEYALINPHSDALDHNQRLYVLSVMQKFKEEYIKGEKKIDHRTYHQYQERLASSGLDAVSFEKPLKLLCIDRVSFGTDQLIHFLIEHDVPVLVTYMSLEDYHEMDTRSLEVDILLNCEFVPSAYKYLHLVSHARFSGWFKESPIAKNLIHVFKNKHREYWTHMENRFISHLVNHAYVLPFTYSQKRVNVPASFRNIASSPFGIIDYNRIMVIDEEEEKQQNIHNEGGVH